MLSKELDFKKISKVKNLFPFYTEDISNFNWEEIQKNYSWALEMNDVPQDAIFHFEGNVGIHTRMVVEYLLSLPEFKKQTEENKFALFMACLLHDVEKRSTTKEEDGRIISPGHAKRGELTARQILYREIPIPFQLREKIAKLVRHHGLPLWIMEKPDPQKSIIEASLVCDTQLLEIIAKADVKGRICNDAEELFYKIELFKEMAIENNCYGKTKIFPSDLSRFVYFNKENTYPDYNPFDDRKFDVFIMSGIPGSGKDFYIKNNLKGYPVVSLDELRLEHKVKPTDKSGTGFIIQLAKEEARKLMRRNQSFIWNGTNLTRQIRQQVIDLCESYGGRVHVVYVETLYKKVMNQNFNREYPIPENILERFINKLEMPSTTEAHSITYIIDGQTIYL